jgi:long-chain fatty acid transport protein
MSKLKLRMLAATLLAAAAFGAGPAGAGGITLYEVGSMDVGLAGAGYAARAQDASTVFTNPAGMTRLAGRQLTAGVQALYGDLDFSIGAGTTAALGAGGGGNPIGWFPGGGLFYSHSLSPDTKLGVAVTGNFGAVVKYDEDWVGRYHLKEGTLLGVSIVPSVATRVDPHWSLGASLVAMRGTFDTAVAVNNLAGPDGQLALDDTAWGYGVRLGVVYEPTATSRFGFTYNSPVSLGFSAPADWSGVGPRLTALLRSRGLYDAQVDLGVTVAQGVMASA